MSYCKTGYFRGHVIFAVGRFCRIADAGTEHSTSTLLFYCRNEKTAVSISLVIDYKSNSCIPFRNTGEVLKSLLCVVCVLKVHATSSSDTARHTVLVERWINSSSSDRCLILKMNSLFFDFSDFSDSCLRFARDEKTAEKKKDNKKNVSKMKL